MKPGDTMESEILKNTLIKHSESETRHLHNEGHDYSGVDCFLDSNNEKVYRFELNRYIPEHSLLVVKNERFAPVPQHVHDYVELNYMFSGSCIQKIGQHQISLKKGQMTFIDTKTPHSIGYTDEDDILINIVVSKQFLNSGFFSRVSENSLITNFFLNAISSHDQNLNYLVFNTQNNYRIQLFLQELLLEYYRPSANAQEIIKNLFFLIILDISNNLENNLDLNSVSRSNSVLIKAMRFMENNFQSCTLEQTATHVNVNPCYLTTLLKKNFGKSFKDIVIKLRLDHGVRLLVNTTDPIEQVAQNCGYNNLNFFYRKFKERYNCTPKQYRDRFSM